MGQRHESIRIACFCFRGSEKENNIAGADRKENMAIPEKSITLWKKKNTGCGNFRASLSALLAVLFLVAGPYLPLLIKQATGAPLVEICTAQGLRLVALPGSEDSREKQSPGDDDRRLGKSCPFCFARLLSFSTPGRVGLPVPSGTGFVLAPLTAFSVSLRPVLLSFSHAPRAPPVSVS